MYKKILSLMLSFIMVISLLPVDAVNAAENYKDVTATEVNNYSDIMYLSDDAVSSLSSDAQQQYQIAVDIAENNATSDVTDVVFARDEEGNLYYSMKLNTVDYSLEEAESEFIEEGTNEAQSTENETEAVISSTETNTEDYSEEPDKCTDVEETIATEETEITSEAENVETVVDEEEIEVVVETTEVEILLSNESITEETEIYTELDLTEETEVSKQDFENENLEYIPTITYEQIEIAEPLDIDLSADLGYDSNDMLNHTNSINGKSNYFYKQLSNVEKEIYDGCVSGMLSGGTSVTLDGLYMDSQTFGQALGAIFLDYPGRLDFYVQGGSVTASAKYTSEWVTTFSFEKSSYYSADIEKKAQEKVVNIVNKAQTWAKENTPENLAYGIIRYIDSSLADMCEYSYDALNASSSSKLFWEAHTKYGALTKGYGVCESYAKAMAYILDTIKIPNCYAVGYTNGLTSNKHAWLEIQMPDGKWYIDDPTWNDSQSQSDGTCKFSGLYFLISNNGTYKATGVYYTSDRTRGYPDTASSLYIPSSEDFKLNYTSYSLMSGNKLKLVMSNPYTGYQVKWSSDNTKIATVDSNGVVTAVGTGNAVITCKVNVGGINKTATCDITAYKVSKFVSGRNEKSTDEVSLTANDVISIPLKVVTGADDINLQQLIEEGVFNEPSLTQTKSEVAISGVEVNSDNTITLTIKALSTGTNTVKIKFAGKAVTVKIIVGQPIDESMFTIAKVSNNSVQYTGKAVKPKVTKSANAPKDLKYKVTYLNNTNAGTASVKISGSGKYGGEIYYNFEITPIDISNGTVGKIKDKIYNGINNPAAVSLKVNKKSLKINKDFIVLYNGDKTVKDAGTYKLTLQGTGNYTGTCKVSDTYTIKPNTISKLSVTCPSSLKYDGSDLDPVVVKIGKNKLSEEDYTVTYYKGTSVTLEGEACAVNVTGKYVAVIKVRGDNIVNTATKTEIRKKFTVK